MYVIGADGQIWNCGIPWTSHTGLRPVICLPSDTIGIKDDANIWNM